MESLHVAVAQYAAHCSKRPYRRFGLIRRFYSAEGSSDSSTLDSAQADERLETARHTPA